MKSVSIRIVNGKYTEVIFSFSNDQIADEFARMNGQSINE